MTQPELAPTDLAPRMRADLLVHKMANAGQLMFEVEDPAAGRRYPLHDFELSIARMLNGRRTVSEVLKAAGDIGIPVSLPSFQGFLRKLSSFGLLDAAAASDPGVAPAAAPGTTWEVRNGWPENVRLQFQSALRAFRTDRFGDAKHHLQQLLAIQPGIPEAVDMLRHVDRVLTQDPGASKVPTFSETYNTVEKTWFTDGESGRSVSSENELPETLPGIETGGRGALVGIAVVVVVGIIALVVPLPYSVKAKCQLLARARYDVKMPRAGVIGLNVVPDGQWVEKGTVIARLDGAEAKAKLESNAGRLAKLDARAATEAPNPKKVAAAKAAHAKAEAELKKAQAQLDQLLAKSKQKRTPPVVKTEKKLVLLKATEAKAAHEFDAASNAAAAKAIEVEKAALAQEKKALEAELASLDVVAPEAGVLAGSAKPKQTLAGDAVFGRLEDTKVLKVVAAVAERDRPWVKAGSAATVTLQSPKGKRVETQVTAVSAEGDAEGTVDNADRALKVGAEGTADITAGTRSLFSRAF